MSQTDVAQPEEEADEAYEAFLEGYDLHLRGGRGAEAEAAYRRAIAGGHTTAWLNLGMLIAGRGRTSEEAAAYRAAMACDDDDIASEAALRLGNMLDNLRGNHSDARACFEFARTHGSGATRQQANVNLAMLLAYEGDRHAAEEALRSYMDQRHPEDAGSDFHVRVARRLTSAASTGRIRSLLRAWRIARYRVQRRVRGLRVAVLGGRA